MNAQSREPAARALPQMSGAPFLTDGGFETTLVFHDGIDLPLFAAFPLVETAEGRGAIRRYIAPYLEIAATCGAGFILETPTWRASSEWGAQLGFTEAEIARINRESVALLIKQRDGFMGLGPVVVSGNIGPRGDGYAPSQMMTGAEAARYHAHQIRAFAETEADMVHAMTMTHTGEAIGIALAARSAQMPVALSFTVETDGRLPSGQALGDAIRETDAATDGYAAYFGINCAHPDHFRAVLESGGDWALRIRSIRANASRCSHAELDAAEELDDGNPVELGHDYGSLRGMLPNLNIFGGCCGTDHRHVAAMAETCIAA